MSRHRSLVATSLYALADFNWSLLMSRHQYLVATSAQVFCSLQLIVYDVATSISCHDISLCPWRFHWLLSVSRLQSSIATTASVKSSSSFQTCHSFKEILMSRPPSPVATSIFVVASRCYRDIIPLVSAHSSSAYLVIPVATCIEFPSIFLISQPHNWTVHTQICINESTSCFHFCSAIRLHFCSTYCCIFLLLFLLSFSLPVNKKLVSFFIFLRIYCPFFNENQEEKWTQNR